MQKYIFYIEKPNLFDVFTVNYKEATIEQQY